MERDKRFAAILDVTLGPPHQCYSYRKMPVKPDHGHVGMLNQCRRRAIVQVHDNTKIKQANYRNQGI